MKEITELHDIQSIRLSMVGKIDEFCSEAGIRYFLAYGTLIGGSVIRGSFRGTTT